MENKGQTVEQEKMKNIDKKVLTINTINIILMRQSGTRENKELLTKTSTGILAQLGEHLPYKQRVTGSSPVGPIDKQICLSIKLNMAE